MRFWRDTPGSLDTTGHKVDTMIILQQCVDHYCLLACTANTDFCFLNTNISNHLHPIINVIFFFFFCSV